MGLRDLLEKQKKFIIPVAALAILVALVLIYRHAAPGKAPIPDAFFSADDGKTWFDGSLTQIPPFDRGGKPAARAILLTADGGKTKTVGWLEKYNDAGKKALANPSSSPPQLRGQLELQHPNLLVKAPGKGDWVPASSPQGQAITNVPPGQQRYFPPIPK